MPILPSNIAPFLRNTKGCKDLYKILNQNNATPTSKLKWEEIYNIEEENWKNIFLAPFNTTPSTTSQWFQLKNYS